METQALILFKYGGNAMRDAALQEAVLKKMVALQKEGIPVVIVHGGGPFIQKALDDAGIKSEFIGGHRKTSEAAIKVVERALKGDVNSTLVGIINRLGSKAVGLSGKDGRMVLAEKRVYSEMDNGKEKHHDLGRVGDVEKMDVSLLESIIHQGFIPVITCIAADSEGLELNVNADMFAGNLAGALQAEQYVVLTDVDGLLQDKDDPSSLIENLSAGEIDQLTSQGVIQGGMIPKLESCKIALAKGAKSARIINGTKPESITTLSGEKASGTKIT